MTNRWQPIETAPKDRRILLVDKTGLMSVHTHNPRMITIIGGNHFYPIAWQELPKFDGVINK